MGEAFFIQIVHKLKKFYGIKDDHGFTDPLELIIWENAAYLVSDEKRKAAFDALKKDIGLKPADILSASDVKLLAVAKLGGIMPEMRVTKLRDIAQTIVTDFDGDLNGAL